MFIILYAILAISLSMWIELPSTYKNLNTSNSKIGNILGIFVIGVILPLICGAVILKEGFKGLIAAKSRLKDL